MDVTNYLKAGYLSLKKEFEPESKEATDGI